MSRTRYVIVIVIVATLAGIGAGVSLAASEWQARPSTQILGRQLYEARSVRTFLSTRRIEQPFEQLDEIGFFAHGGQAEIEWYCGAWASLDADGSSVVSLYIDGRRSASTFLNGPHGSLIARVGILRWVGELPNGRHHIAVRLEQAYGGVALPLVTPPARVPEGLDITEYVSPTAGS
jgi:hypothetical protein